MQDRCVCGMPLLRVCTDLTGSLARACVRAQQRKKYVHTEADLRNRYNITFKDGVLKADFAAICTELGKAETGYESDKERALLQARYPSAQLQPAVVQTAAAASAALPEPQPVQQSVSLTSLGGAAGFLGPPPPPLKPPKPLTSRTAFPAFPPSTQSDFERAMLSHADDIAQSLRMIAQAVTGKASRVQAALNVLNAGEIDESGDGDDEEEPVKRGQKRKSRGGAAVSDDDDGEADVEQPKKSRSERALDREAKKVAEQTGEEAEESKSDDEGAVDMTAAAASSSSSVRPPKKGSLGAKRR